MTRYENRSSCGTSSSFRPNRRDVMRVGWLGGLGLSLGDYFQLQAKAAESGEGRPPRAERIIHIYLPGGFAHIDSFDPKPDAPVDYRGILEAVPTALPGVFFSSHMEHTAKIADKITVVRSMTHTEVDHSRGEHSMFTGYRPSPALVYPSMGSVVAHELGPRGAMPPYVVVPRQGSNFLGSGYLSNAYGPFALGGDPGRSNFRVRDLELPEGVTESRFENRKNWKQLVDRHFSEMESDDKLSTMDSFYQRAYELLSSRESKEAFSLKGETDQTKDLYGMNAWGPVLRPRAGANLLIARRLVEAGARFVTVTYGSWDTHAYHYRGIETQMPDFDKAFAGLITDLDQRGMLDTTLVLVTSEFGRTPRINAGGGRDHWPRVFSIVMAGGGIKRGSIYGSSDALASEPSDSPLSIEDYSTTIYHLLGIDAGKSLMSPGDRPQAIVMNGNVVQDLIA
ncbi:MULTISPECIES: DUF1501 domain-containing protein [Pirellulaceae]|nr:MULTISPECIES: DUF1501 domain-containing protein [Pirellulaceae]